MPPAAEAIPSAPPPKMFDGLASETEEASGNSFEVVRRLKALERKAIVLESNQLGKLKEVHANNDKLSAGTHSESLSGRHC